MPVSLVAVWRRGERNGRPADLTALATRSDQDAERWLGNERLWRQAYYWLAVLGSILASVAGATALADLAGGTVAGVLALTASALTALATALRPARMATGCGEKASQYLRVARGAREDNEVLETGAEKRDRYFYWLEEYDKIRTSPEPPLPSAGDPQQAARPPSGGQPS